MMGMGGGYRSGPGRVGKLNPRLFLGPKKTDVCGGFHGTGCLIQYHDRSLQPERLMLQVR